MGAAMRNGVLGSAPIIRVARGGAAAFVIYSVGVGLSYCSQLLIARMVGVDTYGVYAYVFAWAPRDRRRHRLHRLRTGLVHFRPNHSREWWKDRKLSTFSFDRVQLSPRASLALVCGWSHPSLSMLATQ